MSIEHFALADLMELLSAKAGLPATARTDDPALGFEDLDLDSLAFLQLQGELQDRHGFELPDEDFRVWTFGRITDYVNSRLATEQVA
jgi:minimal PKS acyl carrier protein